MITITCYISKQVMYVSYMLVVEKTTLERATIVNHFLVLKLHHSKILINAIIMISERFDANLNVKLYLNSSIKCTENQKI